jgi:ribosomal protein L24
MKIRKDDKVKIISGKDRGKISKVLKVLKNENKVVVEGVNVVKKHVKPGVIDGKKYRISKKTGEILDKKV